MIRTVSTEQLSGTRYGETAAVSFPSLTGFCSSPCSQQLSLQEALKRYGEWRQSSTRQKPRHCTDVTCFTLRPSYSRYPFDMTTAGLNKSLPRYEPWLSSQPVYCIKTALPGRYSTSSFTSRQQQHTDRVSVSLDKPVSLHKQCPSPPRLNLRAPLAVINLVT